MTLQEAGALLKVLQDAYPREPLPEETLELYARMLLDLPEAVGRQAVLSLIASRPYPTMPPIGEIRQAAARILLQPPTSAEALAEVRDQVRTRGIYDRPTFSHPAIARAVDAIGWRDLCQTEEPAVVHGQFLRVYQSVVDSWLAALQDPLPTPRRQEVLAAIGASEALPSGSMTALPGSEAKPKPGGALERRSS